MKRLAAAVALAAGVVQFYRSGLAWAAGVTFYRCCCPHPESEGDPVG